MFALFTVTSDSCWVDSGFCNLWKLEAVVRLSRSARVATTGLLRACEGLCIDECAWRLGSLEKVVDGSEEPQTFMLDHSFARRRFSFPVGGLGSVGFFQSERSRVAQTVG